MKKTSMSVLVALAFFGLFSHAYSQEYVSDVNLDSSGFFFNAANPLALPPVGASYLRILKDDLLELVYITPDTATWNFSASANRPASGDFDVKVNGVSVSVQTTVGFKRRPLYAPLGQYDLRIENNLYLKLNSTVSDGAAVQVTHTAVTTDWPSTLRFAALKNPTRYSPSIHVNQESYLAGTQYPKTAMVGYFLGDLEEVTGFPGEMNVPALGFDLIDTRSGQSVFHGTLASRGDIGWNTSPVEAKQYQKVMVADFHSWATPGEYILRVDQLGASFPFRIDDGTAMKLARTYALGLYHQRCGTANGPPFTRFVHDACHTAPVTIPKVNNQNNPFAANNLPTPDAVLFVENTLRGYSGAFDVQLVDLNSGALPTDGELTIVVGKYASGKLHFKVFVERDNNGHAVVAADMDDNNAGLAGKQTQIAALKTALTPLWSQISDGKIVITGDQKIARGADVRAILGGSLANKTGRAPEPIAPNKRLQTFSTILPLFQNINSGTINVSGGHHDAGDYSKYTVSSASFIHYLMFAVDNFPGVAALDNLADELLVETNTAGVLAGLAIMNGYDSYLRRSDLTALGSTVLSHTTYSYTNDSRLWTVSDGTNNATYGYIVNSPLVSQIVFKSNSVTRMTTSKQYDYLNRLTQISNAPSASPAVAFNYSYNNANERTRNSAIDGSYWVYQYDSLGQVTSGKKYWADGTSVAGQQFGYNFDDIGNRKSTQTGGNEAGVNLRIARYTNNSLNQITSRDVPGYVNVMGIALATNSVTVNGQPTYRKGEYFRYELEVANTNLAVWTNITVASPGQTSVTGNKFLPKTAEGFYYDADGNLTNDGRWVYTWDGENRLVAMVVNTNVGPQYQLRFAYDAKGLRIQKYVSLNGISIYTNMFLYDGGNLVDELDPANGIVRSYVWGIDISGSLQHAGGVGGLLALSYGSGTTTNSFVAVDGNGNVVALENANDGTSLANFEYGPFGEVIRATGITAKTSPIRFSSKYQDDESGLLYFGYRFYNEFDGKWISRDPLTERGGLNLYAFVSNDPIDKGDILGLQDYKVVGKSFINGFGPRGRLGMRWGLNIPGLPFSEFPWFADTRLGIFERLVTGLPAFNQNPTDDSKDGSYRLFARTIVHVNCDGGHLSSATIDALDSQGGEEFPGIFGTINATANFYTGSSGATLKLRTWGHPNDLVEPGMQWVALRTSRNIWHEAVIKFRCGCEPQVDSFTGSRYPSRKLWINGNLQKDIRQKSISSLWDADFADPSFVAP